MARAVDGMKECSKCGVVKGVEYYGKHKSQSDELCTYCKICNRTFYKKDLKKKYYEDHKEKILEYYKIDRKENKGKYKELAKKDRYNAYNRVKKYRINNSEKVRFNRILYNYSKKLDVPKEEIPEMLIEAKIHFLDAKKVVSRLSD